MDHSTPASTVISDDSAGRRADRSWELTRIAYEAHFELARHHSSLTFQARIAITTVMVLALALTFGYLPAAASEHIEFQKISARGLVAYVAALFLNLLFAMEMTYLMRFYRIVQSGREIERKHQIEVYFATYEPADSWPLYFAYLGGIILLVALFFGDAWVPGQTCGRSVALIITGAVPVAAFIWSYVHLRRLRCKLFGKPKD